MASDGRATWIGATLLAVSKPSIVTTTVVLSIMAALSLGCSKRHDDKEKAATAAPPPPPPPAPPPPPPAPRMDVPFKGTYTKYSEATWKNGRRVSVSNASGAASITIDGAGKVTYAQSYTARGKKLNVTQIYTFGADSMKAIGGGSYDVALVFQSISGDTQSYSPDKNKPKLEARRQGNAWQIGLLTTDNNGVMGGVEFK
ncbi:FKBP-type peptidyl-prolyl cis-trans isomerase FklB [Minicystis rosea]|nr:FKBP-type peptidyl-prolyl cis-trans isomerase FklB [Minicystis rosea]